MRLTEFWKRMDARFGKVYARSVASDYRLPWAPVSTVIALAFFAMVVVLLFFSDSGRIAVVVGAIWFAGVTVGYVISTRRGARTAA